MFLLLIFLCLFQGLNSYFYKNNTISNLSQITSLSITSDNQYLIIANIDHSQPKLNIFQKNITNPNYTYSPHQYIQLGKHIVNVLYLSKDNYILLVGTFKDKISYYLLNKGELKYIMAIDGWTGDQNDVDMSIDDNFLVIGNTNGTISVYENYSSQTTQDHVDLNDTTLNSPDFFGGSRPTTSSKKNQDSQQGFPLNYKLMQTIQSPNTSVSSVKISPNSSKLYVGYYNKSLLVYNLKNYSYSFSFRQDLNDDVITCMELSQLGKILVTGSQKGAVRMYVGSSNGNQLFLNQIFYQPKSQQILSIRISNDNLMVLVTTINQNTFIYTGDVQNNKFYYNQDQSYSFVRNPIKHVTIKQPQNLSIPENSNVYFDKSPPNKNDQLHKNGINQNETLTKTKNNQTKQTTKQTVNSTVNSQKESFKQQIILLELQKPTLIFTQLQNMSIEQVQVDSTLDVTIRNVPIKIQQNKTNSHLPNTGQQNQTPITPSPQTTNNSSLSNSASDPQPQPRLVPTFLSFDNSLFIQAQGSSLGIYVACDHTLNMCSYCNSNSKCLGCLDYYYMYLGKCRPCASGCRVCKSNRVCQKCENQYYLNISQAICYKCNDTLTNCLSCESPKKCLICAEGYIQQKGVCEVIPVTKDQEDDTQKFAAHVAMSSIVSHADQIEEQEGSESSWQTQKLFTVFVITCIVFVILLIATVFLLYYINRLSRRPAQQQSSANIAIGQYISNLAAASERRISSQASV